MKYRFVIYLIGLTWIGLGLSSCNKDFDYIKPLPNVAFVRNVDTKFGPRGTLVRIKLDLQAANGLGSLKVAESIQGAGFTELESINTFSENFKISEFEYLYRVDTIQNPSLIDGDNIRLRFVLEDKEGKATNPVFFNITVGGTFIETQETINGNQVIALRRPAGAIITLLNDEDFVFRSGIKYLIQGVFEIEEGLTIRMEEGAEIYGETGQGEIALFRVPPSAKLLAEGTATNPIVMTSDKVLKGESPAPGDWQGLEVEGNAVINPSNGQPAVVNDDSGIYRYIRVEYGGKSATSADLTASIRFNNVGTGTEINYLQSFKSVEIGVRFNGGNAQAKYLVVTDSQDHSYRLDDLDASPFVGNGQFWVAENNNVDVDGEDLRIQDGAGITLANITFTGPGQNSGFSNSAARIRSNAGSFKIFNAIFTEYPNSGIRVENSPEPTDAQGANTLAYSFVFNIAGSIFRNNAASYTNPPFNNTVGIAIDGISVGAYVPSTTQTSTFNPQTLDNWFSPALFVGAIENSTNDWTANGNWCKNSDGTIR